MANEKKKKILMVDDDTTQSLMYQIEFTNFGLELLVVNEGDKAIETIKKEKPDLVLLDLLIGGINGKDVLKQIKSDQEIKDVKVVIMSNYKKNNLAEECLAAGATDYWVKCDLIPRQVVEKTKELLK